MLSVPDIPAESRQLHDHDHLRASDVDRAGRVCILALDVRDTHVAHDHHKANPRHVRTFHVGSNKVGGSCIGNDQGQSSPEIEQANEIEDSNSDDVPVLQLRVVVWQTLEDTG